MPGKTLKTTLYALALGFLLSACQADVLIETKLDASGGGTFTLGVALDQEARVGIAAIPGDAGGSSLDALTAMFDRLRARGWQTATTEPQGGLSIVASKAFKNSAEFDTVLEDLRAPGVGAPPPGSPQIKLDFGTSRGFFRTRSTFSGVFDTAPADTPENERLRDALKTLSANGALDFEVRAQLPGAVRVDDGEGAVVGDSVVWRPQLGTSLRFVARSSALRVGSVLLVILPALLLLCVLAWMVLGKRAPAERLAIMPEEIIVPEAQPTTAAQNGSATTIVLEPDPVEQLLAIERDPIES